MNERYGYVTTTGEIKVLGKNIYDAGRVAVELRKTRRAWCSSVPIRCPSRSTRTWCSGCASTATATRLRTRALDEAVEKALTEVGLWRDLKDRLDTRATDLQLEQQQKLCIARLLPLKPEVILMDEPCSALDIEGTRAIEELMSSCEAATRSSIVTHNMAQARRASDECIFMLLGELIEHSRTEDLFLTPGRLPHRRLHRRPLRLVSAGRRSARAAADRGGSAAARGRERQHARTPRPLALGMRVSEVSSMLPAGDARVPSNA